MGWLQTKGLRAGTVDQLISKALTVEDALRDVKRAAGKAKAEEREAKARERKAKAAEDAARVLAGTIADDSEGEGVSVETLASVVSGQADSLAILRTAESLVRRACEGEWTDGTLAYAMKIISTLTERVDAIAAEHAETPAVETAA
jgi:hypothetical protein